MTASTPPFVLGYGSNGFTDHTLMDAVTVLHEMGYRALALTIGHPHVDPFTPDGDRVVAALGARLRALGWRVVIETGARYTLDPRRKHAPTLLDDDAAAREAFLIRAIAFASALDADCVSLWSGVLPQGVTAQRAHLRLRTRLARILDAAAAARVTLAIEPEPGMLIETVADALALHHDLGAPSELGLTVDLGHCLVVEPDGVTGALLQAGTLLRNVQVDDGTSAAHLHRELGDGELDLVAAFRTLSHLNYTGVATVELPRHSHDAPGVASRSFIAMTSAWENV